MSNVRAKVTCMFKKESKDNNGKVYQTEVHFGAVYSDDPKSENKFFWDATPQMSMQMTITNKPAADAFEIGKEYYLDFKLVG